MCWSSLILKICLWVQYLPRSPILSSVLSPKRRTRKGTLSLEKWFIFFIDNALFSFVLRFAKDFKRRREWWFPLTMSFPPSDSIAEPNHWLKRTAAHSQGAKFLHFVRFCAKLSHSCRALLRLMVTNPYEEAALCNMDAVITFPGRIDGTKWQVQRNSTFWDVLNPVLRKIWHHLT